MERAEPTTLQALGYTALTAALALPLMICTWLWFTH
jgi:hypothetical protein